MDRTRLLTAGASLLASTLILSGRVTAQETEKQPEPEKARLESPDAFREETPQEEMIRLFHEVERSLEGDRRRAGRGRRRGRAAPERRERYRSPAEGTSEKGRQAVDGIDRILQLAQEMSGKSGGT
jgi:hypothetical protein